jgi:hypothetical protein
MPFDFQEQQFTETKPDLDEVGLVLMRAAEIIRERGWCQHNLKDSIGRMCMVGAITEAQSCLGISAAGRAQDAVRHELQINGFISDWNNAPERTADEVIQALESAALTRQKGAQP